MLGLHQTQPWDSLRTMGRVFTTVNELGTPGGDSCDLYSCEQQSHVVLFSLSLPPIPLFLFVVHLWLFLGSKVGNAANRLKVKERVTSSISKASRRCRR